MKIQVINTKAWIAIFQIKRISNIQVISLMIKLLKNRYKLLHNN